jgi:hypothetical protein
MEIEWVKRGAGRLSFWAMLFCVLVIFPLAAGAQPATSGAPAPLVSAPQTDKDPSMILGLSNKAGAEKSPNLTLEMGGQLLVELDGTRPLDASKWVLYLGG